jgi:serine/threonine protein kinase
LYPYKRDFEDEYQWTNARRAGDGQHGMVYKCLHIPTGKTVAMKKFIIELNREGEVIT